MPQILKNSRFVAYNSATKLIEPLRGVGQGGLGWLRPNRKNFKINISEKKRKCLRYRHNFSQKKRPFGRAQNITMPKY